MANEPSIKKLKLVDEAELTRLIMKQLRDYDPALQVLAQMKQEMDSALQHTDITPDEKIALFKSIQQRFSHIKQEMEPVTLASVSTQAVPPLPLEPVEVSKREANKESQEASRNSNVETPSLTPKLSQFEGLRLNTRHRQMMTNLLNIISKAPNILTFDPNTDELVIEGKKIPRSSFTESIKQLYRKNENENSPGFGNFLNALGRILIDNKTGSQSPFKDVIPRYSLYQRMHSLQTGSGKKESLSVAPVSCPPGKPIQALHLYYH